MIPKEEFKDTFYYIAGGFDFQPLYRFSHICTHFFYANLFYTKQEVLNSIKQDLGNSEYLEIVSIKDHDTLSSFEIDPGYTKQFESALSAFSMTENENYFYDFVPELKEKQWILEVDLIRKDLNRKIKLYYFTGEGLSSYIALSQNGKYAPKVICTIQTEALEKSFFLLSKFLMKTETLPLMWLRGSETYINEFSRNYNSAVNQDKIFTEVGLSFNFNWLVSDSYFGQFNRENITTKRYCKSYITEEAKNIISNMPFKTYPKHKIVKGDIRNTIPINIIEKTAVFKSIKYKSKDVNPNLTEFYWEDICKNNLLESLNFIKKQDDKRIFNTIYFTINGLEDEGIFLDEFLKKEHHAKMIVVVKDWVDLIDLRESI